MGGGGQFWDGQFFLTVLLVCAAQNGWGRGGCKCLCVWERESEHNYVWVHMSMCVCLFPPFIWSSCLTSLVLKWDVWSVAFFFLCMCVFFKCNFLFTNFMVDSFSLCAGCFCFVLFFNFVFTDFTVKSHWVLFCDVKRKHGYCKEHEVSVISPKTVTLLFVSDCLSGIFKSFAW